MQASHKNSLVVLLTICASLALMIPVISQGFIVDDTLILSVIEKWYPKNPNSFDIYSTLLDQAQLAWWTDPELDIVFFRPLGSALLRLDYLIFGHWSPGWYLHSLLWLAAFLAVLAGFYRRLVPGWALVALAIFALDECFAFLAGWIANRHALVAMTLGTAGLWAHLRWREDGWRPGLPLAVLGFVLALMTAETGLAPLSYVIAYELFAGSGTGRRRWLGLLPPAVIGATYVLWYRSMGYGFHGGAGFYIDPGADPWYFLRAAAARIPALLGGALTGVPPDLWIVPELRPWLVGIGLVATFPLALALRAGWCTFDAPAKRHLRWLIAGSLMSMVPLAATAPSHRMACGPMLGIAVALAALLELLWKRWRPAGGWRRVSAILATGILVAIHALLAPISRWIIPRDLVKMHSGLVQGLEGTPHWHPDDGYRDVLVLQAPDTVMVFYGPIFLDDLHDTARRRWHALTAAPFDHRLTRTGPRTLELEVLGGEMLATELEISWPPDDAVVADAILERNGFDAHILTMGERGPTRVGFTFARSLDAPDLLVLTWLDGGFRPVELPAQGQSIMLRHTPSAMAFPGLKK